MDSRFQLLDSKSFSVELGFRIPIVNGVPDSKAQDSGFHKQIFPRFRNPDSLTWCDRVQEKIQPRSQGSLRRENLGTRLEKIYGQGGEPTVGKGNVFYKPILLQPCYDAVIYGVRTWYPEPLLETLQVRACTNAILVLSMFN